MKVIDLLQRIANGELEDTKFKYDDDYFMYLKKPNQIDRYVDKTFSTVEYYNDKIYTPESLNDEVEIIEEDKKIETIDPIDPIDYCHSTDTSKDMVLVEKINEIIKVLNKVLVIERGDYIDSD